MFVSNHLIPESFEFNTAHEPCYQVRRALLCLASAGALRCAALSICSCLDGGPAAVPRMEVACAGAPWAPHHALPPPASLQTADGEQKIVPASEVRLRIVGTRVDASDIVSGAGTACGAVLWGTLRRTLRPRRGGPAPRTLADACSPAATQLLQFAVGSIKEDYLGVISVPM